MDEQKLLLAIGQMMEKQKTEIIGELRKEFRGEIGELRSEMDQRFEAVHGEIGGLKEEIVGIKEELRGLNRRFDDMELRFDETIREVGTVTKDNTRRIERLERHTNITQPVAA